MSARERRSLRGSSLRLVPQRAMTSLNPVRSVIKQFRQFAKSAGCDDLTAEDLSLLLRRVGLALEPGQLKRYPHEFSGGQLQRMFIAAGVLLGEPAVVFADEPTSTLDTTVRSQILELVRRLRSEVNVSVIFVSHDLGVVAQVCDRVLVMYAGEVVENADVNSLFEDPKHPYTRALLGALAERHQPHELLTAIPGKVSDSLRIETGCRFAPRCANAFEPCTSIWPADRRAGSSLVKCHLYSEGEQ
jgi:peptide/nickel transport system ATP-binding protein